MKWTDKKFNELTVNELFRIYKLRAAVFNTEQNSNYCDPDDNDPRARHVFATKDDHLVAYARYFVESGKVTFGRVVVNPDFRGQGISKQLVSHLLKGIKDHYGDREIFIHAQTYITGLYRQFDFEPEGDVFIEADRKHILMTHPALKNEKG